VNVNSPAPVAAGAGLYVVGAGAEWLKRDDARSSLIVHSDEQGPSGIGRQYHKQLSLIEIVNEQSEIEMRAALVGNMIMPNAVDASDDVIRSSLGHELSLTLSM
jgi:hypothetical protein